MIDASTALKLGSATARIDAICVPSLVPHLQSAKLLLLLIHHDLVVGDLDHGEREHALESLRTGDRDLGGTLAALHIFMREDDVACGENADCLAVTACVEIETSDALSALRSHAEAECRSERAVNAGGVVYSSDVVEEPSHLKSDSRNAISTPTI